jgi:hypothetical protein
MSDLHYAIRGMLRNPGFSLLACLSLAIGIGANTAIYSVIDAVLLGPLPHLSDTTRLAGIVSDVVSYPLYRDIRDRAPSFESVAGFSYRSVSLTGRGPATLARAGVVSGNFLATPGTGAVSGRALLSSDDTPSADVAVAVVNETMAHHYWPGRSPGRRSHQALESLGRGRRRVEGMNGVANEFACEFARVR